MRFSIFFFLFAAAFNAFSQTPAPRTVNLIDQQGGAITTAVPFLMITPDARAAGNGDVGAATSPDVNSAYWNAGKTVFNEKDYAVTGSFTPWLAKIINDMYLFYLTGYYKIDRKQAVALSVKYFDLGKIQFRDVYNTPQGAFNPREFAIDANYSRLLTEYLSAGASLRFIHSNLIGSGNTTGTDVKPANTVAVDLGAFYTRPLESVNSVLSLGANISNLGGKMTYSDANSKDFIPINLRLGAAYKINLDPENTITFSSDLNKLMVPSPRPSAKGSSLLGGMFASFTDAPGGFKEEIQEFTISMGTEYWYKDFLSGRLGYFLEAKDKGNRKYLTIGTGFRFLEKWGVDVAYLVPTNRRDNALAEALRITVMASFEKVKKKKENLVE